MKKQNNLDNLIKKTVYFKIIPNICFNYGLVDDYKYLKIFWIIFLKTVI